MGPVAKFDNIYHGQAGAAGDLDDDANIAGGCERSAGRVDVGGLALANAEPDFGWSIWQFLRHQTLKRNHLKGDLLGDGEDFVISLKPDPIGSGFFICIDPNRSVRF